MKPTQKNRYSRALRKLSEKLVSLSRRIDYYGCTSDVFRHVDCLETIDSLLKFTRPKTIYDIGANDGHWTRVLQQTNPELQHVVLFEPQQKYQESLSQLSLPGVKKVIYQCGLGEKRDTRLLRGGTASASFLVAEEQCAIFPNSIENEEEGVEIRILDEIYAMDRLPVPDLIKLDVQGFELNVLMGGEKVLQNTAYLVIELSLRQLYRNQPSLWHILRFLEEHHYVMVGRGFEWRSTTNPAEIIQFDAIFKNTQL